MIARTLIWIEQVNRRLGLNPKRILEIGSIDTNGSPRGYFSGDYLGIDIREGPGVDLILNGYEIANYFKHKFDAVLCLHLLEHTAKPWVIAENVRKVLNKGGLFYVSVPTFRFPRHDYPNDYWRPSEEAVKEVIMEGFEILDFELGSTAHKKYPIINCLGKLCN
jgi:SAM-dependent methyltransferase